MSLKMIDSGDGQRTYISPKFPGGLGGATYVSAPSGQSGTWMQLNTLGGARGWYDEAYTNDTLIVGFRAELPAVAGSYLLGRICERTSGVQNNHISFFTDGAGRVFARRGQTDGTIIATGTVPLPFGSGCRFIEFKAKIANSGGTVQLRVDEIDYLNVSGLDTQNAGTAKANVAIILGSDDSNGFNSTWKFRDVYVAGTDGSVNNDFLGVCKTGVKTVSGAGNSAQFTPLSGTNASNVDDGTTVDNDTSYNEDGTVGHKDTFALTSSGLASGAVILGTQTMIIAKKTDAAARSLGGVIRSGGTDFDLTSNSLGTSYVGYREIQEVDPNTSAAWTQTNLDAAELGYKTTV